MNTAYNQGYAEGRRGNADTRYCPYEGTRNVLDWLDGHAKGLAAYREHEARLEVIREEGRKAARDFGPGHPCPHVLSASEDAWRQGYESELVKLNS